MVDVRRDVLRPPHCTTPAAMKSNKNQKWDLLRAMKTFIRKLQQSENDWDLAINMADMWHLGLGKKVCLYDVIDIVLQ